MAVIQASTLTEWATLVAEGLGYAPDDAAYLAASLVDANLRGVDSHGVIRLPIYAERIRNGLVRPTAKPKISTLGGVIIVDANGASGQIAARDAQRALATATRELGVATATVRGSAHFGSAGYYARALASEGLIALVVSNSEPIVVPFGGREALLGTNPFAFAAPTAGPPLSLDMATSTIAMGKVMVAQARRETIPDSWGVDENGMSTTDPAAVRALLPVGGPKGYGLGMLVEVLGGVLSGASIAHQIGNQYGDMSRSQDVGHWMMALDVAAFMPIEEFHDRMQTLIAMTRAITPQDAERPVLLPGEPEELTSAQRLREGIPIPDDTITELAALGEQLTIPFEHRDGLLA